MRYTIIDWKWTIQASYLQRHRIRRLNCTRVYLDEEHRPWLRLHDSLWSRELSCGSIGSDRALPASEFSMLCNQVYVHGVGVPSRVQLVQLGSMSSPLVRRCSSK